MDNSIVMSSTDGNVITDTLALLIAMGTAALVLSVLLGLVWYILEAMGFYKLSKNRGIEPAWLAWIPIGQNYLLGELIGNKVWGFGYAKWILVGGSIFSILVAVFSDNLPEFVAILFLILIIAIYIYTMTAMYQLYKIYSTKAIIMIIFSVIFPFLSSIFVFVIRNHQPLVNINNVENSEIQQK